MNALGIDVSKWQDANTTPTKPDFDKAKLAGADFVFIKASQACWMDEDFRTNWFNARCAGMLRGAYHYMDWTQPADAQAHYFYQLLQADPGELPPVLDYECRANVPGAGTARQACHDFLEVIKAHLLKQPMLYTSPFYWYEFGSGDVYWRQYPLWIAHYTTATQPTVPAPWQQWHFWQYTSHGDGPKFGMESLNVDMDYFNGTLTDLLRWCGSEPPAPTLEDRVSNLENDLAAVHAWIASHG